MKLQNLFLDNGGVITDNTQLAVVYPRLVGEFFAPRLGGSEDEWAEANRRAIADGVDRRYFERLDALPEGDADIVELTGDYLVDWLRTMCAFVGVPLPPDETLVRQIALEADLWVQSRARTPYPGAVETVMGLARDFTLYSASDGQSSQMQAKFKALGIDHCFRTLYGPDLVRTPKGHRAFYPRVFADAGVDPSTSVVVDDNPRMVANARHAGAIAVLVSRTPGVVTDADAVIADLSDLPSALLTLRDGLQETGAHG